ncbi:hypothetical protein FIA58_014395 [Flavobacterium jejuense]|uniref:Uncharacterized protein n=1 Tax=Flavobacterium jejuense TaxID=1544455 RepID=A0ABX0ITL1_9FLAO|nr:hypothetical protein [Flavobacterium jejuense]NHN26871.1 hypothetical protein [Flavobacterium jejuense]
MKKVTLILALIGMITLQSCVKEEVIREVPVTQPDNDTISEVFEYSNVDFNNGNNYNVFLDFPYQIYNSDMVLVYHLYDVVNGQDVWRLMPQTYYDGNLEIDYNFDFTTFNANVILGSNYALNTLPSVWTQNQVFRAVVIPASFGNRMANPVDFNDYKAVIDYYGINDNNVMKISK